MKTPEIITRYFAAANRFDAASAAECFTSDARVHDEGHDHVGQDAVRAWIAATSKKYQPKSEVIRAKVSDAKITLAVSHLRQISRQSHRTRLRHHPARRQNLNAQYHMNSERPNLSIDPAEFAGKRVFVTGGTKGAGEAIVRRFAAGGARVATTARSAPKKSDLPGIFVAADLGTAIGATKAAEAIIGSLGLPDIIVHNLGGSKAPGGGFAALSDELWQDELNLNLLAAVRLDRSFVPAMVQRAAGVVIHIALNPAPAALAGIDDRLCRRESRAHHLQQGPVQGSWPEGCPRDLSVTGLDLHHRGLRRWSHAWPSTVGPTKRPLGRAF